MRQGVSIKDTLWRVVEPEFGRRPLNAVGALIRGGRFNSPGVPAIYLATDPQTAMLEVAPTHDFLHRPQLVVPVEVDLGLLFDFTDPSFCKDWGFDPAALYSEWSLDPAAPSPGQVAANDLLQDQSFVGAKYRSKANPYLHNYVIWRFIAVRKVRRPSGGTVWEVETPMKGLMTYDCLLDRYSARAADDYRGVDETLDKAVMRLSKIEKVHADYGRLSEAVHLAADEARLSPPGVGPTPRMHDLEALLGAV